MSKAFSMSRLRFSPHAKVQSRVMLIDTHSCCQGEYPGSRKVFSVKYINSLYIVLNFIILKKVELLDPVSRGVGHGPKYQTICSGPVTNGTMPFANFV